MLYKLIHALYKHLNIKNILSKYYINQSTKLN